MGEYTDDNVEYPYTDEPQRRVVLFDEGILEGVKLYTTEEYCNIAYPNGEIDAEAMEDILKMVKERDNLVIFDIGGFVGANALVYAKMLGDNGKVVVFEPNPYNRNRIFRNASYNSDIAKQITVEKIALGNSEGITEMLLSSNIDNGHSSTSRVSKSHAKIADNLLPNGFEKHQVEISTIDAYIEKTGLVPDIIKVDVEGAEAMLLQGAIKLIEKYSPIFFIEYHSEYCATMCTQLLVKAGYNIYPLKEEPDNRLIIKAERKSSH